MRRGPPASEYNACGSNSARSLPAAERHAGLGAAAGSDPSNSDSCVPSVWPSAVASADAEQ